MRLIESNGEKENKKNCTLFTFNELEGFYLQRNENVLFNFHKYQIYVTIPYFTHFVFRCLNNEHRNYNNNIHNVKFRFKYSD